MEPFEHHGCWSSVPAKRRSNTHRKPRVDLHLLANDVVAVPSLVSLPSSDDSDEQSPKNGRYDSNRKKVNNIKIVVLKKSSVKGFEKGGQPNGVTGSVSSKSANQRFWGPELKRCTDGMTALNSRMNLSSEKMNLGRMSVSSDDHSNCKNPDGHRSYQLGKSSNGLTESKLRMMKLKVGGVTHTLQTKAKGGSGCAVNLVRASGNKLKLIHKGEAKEEIVPRTDNPESVRKSKRDHKNHAAYEAFDDGDAKQIVHPKRSRKSKDDSLKHAKDAVYNVIDKKNNSRILKKRKAGYDEDEDYAIRNKKSREGKKSRSDIDTECVGHVQDDGRGCGVASNAKDIVEESLGSGIEEFSLMTRRRALQSSRGVAGGAIEFPNGLPSPPRRQKVQLSEVERQLKKAEAAQRRKLQLEKAARESEAEAIRKILGHDSSKKRKDKLRQKLQQAQEREAKSSTLTPNCVRWVIGPTGTTVMFPEGVELPSILNSKPCSYPPPREKCAGPSCGNPYKYRDSKTNLPLCSLQCYRAVQQNNQQFCVC